MKDDITEAIVEDIRRVAHRLGSNSLARSEYYQHGKYSHYQVYDGGNDWTTLCERAGISGLFVLNTVTGEGWWTNGKVLGKPE